LILLKHIAHNPELHFTPKSRTSGCSKNSFALLTKRQRLLAHLAGNFVCRRAQERTFAREIGFNEFRVVVRECECIQDSRRAKLGVPLQQRFDRYSAPVPCPQASNGHFRTEDDGTAGEDIGANFNVWM
jgi:hypothetical protein